MSPVSAEKMSCIGRNQITHSFAVTAFDLLKNSTIVGVIRYLYRSYDVIKKVFAYGLGS